MQTQTNLRQMIRVVLAFSLLFLLACGMKGPPLPPETEPETKAPMPSPSPTPSKAK